MFFEKNSITHPEITKCHQNWGMRGQYVTCNTFSHFFKKDIALLEVTSRNKETDRNFHISIPAKVKSLIFYIVTPHTLNFNIPTKSDKFVAYFEVTASRSFLV